MEIGITGGEEDGVNNEHVEQDKLYTTPEDIDLVYSTLSKISPRFNIAAAFGNVHGVYKAGNVVLKPSILGDCQKYIREKYNLKDKNPCFFVFHGGSGSSAAELAEAVSHGVVKFNIDTDTQWGYWYVFVALLFFDFLVLVCSHVCLLSSFSLIFVVWFCCRPCFRP